MVELVALMYHMDGLCVSTDLLHILNGPPMDSEVRNLSVSSVFGVKV